VSDLLVSLIEGVAGAAAAAAERRRQGSRPLRATRLAYRPVAAPAQTVSVQVAPPSPPPKPVAAQPAPTPPPPPEHHGLLAPIFEGPDGLVRAILAGEIFGKPLALRGPNLWDAPGV